MTATIRPTGTATGAFEAALAVMLSAGLGALSVVVVHHRLMAPVAAGRISAGSVGAYTAGWAVMVSVMMIPTLAPLLRALASIGPDRRAACAALAGYVALWTVCGTALLGFDAGLRRTARASGLALDPRTWTAGLLGLAAVIQGLAAWKRWGTACRSPSVLVMEGWTGRQPITDGARIGWRYGVACVRCCLAATIVMFAVAMASPLLMAVSGMAMVGLKSRHIGRLVEPVLATVFAVAAVAVPFLSTPTSDGWWCHLTA